MKTPKPTFTNGFGSFRYDISFLWDDLDAENIRDGYTLPVCHLDHAVDSVDPLDRSGDSLVAASVLSLIRHKVGDGHRWSAGKQFLKVLQFCVDARDLALIKLDAPVRQPTCFRDGSVVAGQGCKGGKLRRAVVQRHARMVLRGRMREVNDIVVFAAHALCPPIWPLRSRAVAPSK